MLCKMHNLSLDFKGFSVADAQGFSVKCINNTRNSLFFFSYILKKIVFVHLLESKIF